MNRWFVTAVLIVSACPLYAQNGVRFETGLNLETITRDSGPNGDRSEPMSIVVGAQAKTGRLMLEAHTKLKEKPGRPQMRLSGNLGTSGLAFPFEPSIREYGVTGGVGLLSGVYAQFGYDRFLAMSRVMINNLPDRRETFYEALSLGLGGNVEVERFFASGGFGWYPRIFRLDAYRGGDNYRRHGDGWTASVRVGYKILGPLGAALSYRQRRTDTEDPFWSLSTRQSIREKASFQTLGLELTMF